MIPRTSSRRSSRTRFQTRPCVVALFLAISLAVLADTGLAQNDSSSREQTQTLIALNSRYQRAGAAERAALLDELLVVAATRRQALAALVENDPAEVLRIALTADIRDTLPPAVQRAVEEFVQIEGDLEVLVEDRDDGSQYHYFLDTGRARFSLHFAADPPKLQTGARIRAHGVQVSGALALASGTISVQSLSPALPNTLGEQRTVVLLVNFLDKPTQPYTPAYANTVVFFTTSNYDWEASQQQTWLSGQVHGWYTIPLSSTVCDSSLIATYAKQAATADGVDLSWYSRFVYAFPNNACGWWGLGSVGGNPSQAWINGSLELRVVGHEMGHNFGLYHSHALECGKSTLGSNCSNIEYGDTLDIMGGSSAHFNAFQKERLGWLAYGISPPITTVTASGTYQLAVFESISSSAEALKILKAIDPTSGAKTWYYVEARQGIGFDSFLGGNNNVLTGVVIHTGAEASASSSYLLDMTPKTSSWSDPALDVGKSFSDADAQVTIRPLSVSSTGASVSVTFGPVPSPHP
jgi:hypothetical protein